jgi:hypothetical protein
MLLILLIDSLPVNYQSVTILKLGLSYCKCRVVDLLSLLLHSLLVKGLHFFLSRLEGLSGDELMVAIGEVRDIRGLGIFLLPIEMEYTI